MRDPKGPNRLSSPSPRSQRRRSPWPPGCSGRRGRREGARGRAAARPRPRRPHGREARDLRRPRELYEGERPRRPRVFDRHRSLQARIGVAFARWPRGTQGRLEQLSAVNPRSAAVRLHLGLAYFWAGRDAEALAEWRAAAQLEPDSLFAVRAADLLHPGQAPGLPAFVPGFEGPAELGRVGAAAQLALLRRNASRPDARAKLLYGVALQRLGRPVSAERLFAEAARLAPAIRRPRPPPRSAATARLHRSGRSRGSAR